MAKIARKVQKVFATSASNNGQFGSAQAGTPTTSTDPDVIQQLAAYDSGWLAAVLSGAKLPPLEELQGLQYLFSRQIAYLFQEGIAEYDGDTEYHENSIVKQPGTYKLYGSITNNNTGNALTDPANWELLVDLTNVFTSADIATQPQAEAGTNNTKLITPLRAQQHLEANGWHLFDAATASSDAEIVVTGLDTDNYEHEFIWYRLRPATNGVDFESQLSTDGGATFVSTNSYARFGRYSAPATMTGNFLAASGSMRLDVGVGSISNSTSYAIDGTLKLGLYDGVSDTLAAFFDANQTDTFPNGLGIRNEYSMDGFTSSPDAIRFYFSSGNIAAGRLVVYRRRL